METLFLHQLDLTAFYEEEADDQKYSSCRRMVPTLPMAEIWIISYVLFRFRTHHFDCICYLMGLP